MKEEGSIIILRLISVSSKLYSSSRCHCRIILVIGPTSLMEVAHGRYAMMMVRLCFPNFDSDARLTD